MRNFCGFECQGEKAGVLFKHAGCLLMILVLAFGCIAENAFAESDRGRGGQSNQIQKRQRISAGQAAAKAQRQHGGEVLKVRAAGDGYRVKLLLPSGTVKTVFIGSE
jgi:hypothetical protein